MASQKDVRRIALDLPGTVQKKEGFFFSVRNGDKLKGYPWVWQERVDPKKPRVPNPGVLAVRVADLDERDMRLATGAGKLFTEPHYAGFPAVLVRLEKVPGPALRSLLPSPRACQGPNPRRPEP